MTTTDPSRYVTDEILERATAAGLQDDDTTEHGWRLDLQATLEAVAGDIAATVRAECAAELRVLAKQEARQVPMGQNDPRTFAAVHYGRLTEIAGHWEATP